MRTNWQHAEHRVSLVRRFLYAVLVAVILAASLVVLNADVNDGECDDNNEADEADCEAVMLSGGCSVLEPYSYWWFFFNCSASGGGR